MLILLLTIQLNTCAIIEPPLLRMEQYQCAIPCVEIVRVVGLVDFKREIFKDYYLAVNIDNKYDVRRHIIKMARRTLFK